MHELGIVAEVIDLVAAEVGAAKKVTRVVLEVGSDTCVSADALRFAFELVAEGTVVEGATLAIDRTPGDVLKIREVEALDVQDLRM